MFISELYIETILNEELVKAGAAAAKETAAVMKRIAARKAKHGGKLAVKPQKVEMLKGQPTVVTAKGNVAKRINAAVMDKGKSQEALANKVRDKLRIKRPEYAAKKVA